MEMYFNLFKVKYEYLLELLRYDKTVNITTNDTVNIFINLESIFIKLSNPKLREELVLNQKSASIQFISCIINLAAHYRWFFTKYKINSKIFLYYPTFDECEYKNKIFNNEYRRYYDYKFKEDVQNSVLYKIISSAIPFIKLMVEYIEGVYFIDSKNIENSVIPYIIHSADETNSTNFIVTGSMYDFQYVNFDFKIIVPRKDESVILNKHNVITYIADICECLGTYNFSYKFLPFILSIVGSKSRNIYNIKGVHFKSAFKIIQTALDNRVITNDSTNIKMLINIIKPTWKEHIMNNYYCTDIVSQYNQLNAKNLYSITSQLSDKFDNASLKKINDKYFNKFPVMLMEITASPKTIK